MKTVRDYDYYIVEAQKAEDSSHGLWKGINQCIRSVLQTQQRLGTPLRQIPKILREIAGPQKTRQGDMTSIDNFWKAARQIECGEELFIL